MRKRLMVLVAATTALVLLVFVIPLGLIMARFAAASATAEATTRAQSLVVLLATADRRSVQAAVEQLNAVGAAPVTVFLPNGDRLGAPAARTTAVQLAQHGRSVTVATGDGREVALAVVGLPTGTAVVRTFVGTAQLQRGVGRAWLILVFLGLLLLLLAILVADRLARSLVRPIADVAQVSLRLAAGDFDARAGATGPSEIKSVSTALNRLAERIQDQIHQAREDVADLSHRLRTPMTALRMEVDMLAAGTPTTEQVQRVASRVDGLERAVTALIRDARRRGDETPQRCDASAVVRDRVEFWSPLANDEGRPVTVELPEPSTPVRARAADLSAALDALLGNVFTHTPVGTPFAVILASGGAGARLTVADRGPGLGADVDAVRRGASGAGSTGLGLDIARRVALESGGALHVEDSADGVRVTLELGSR